VHFLWPTDNLSQWTANRLGRQLGQVIAAGGVPLGAAQMFQCLGRLLACNDNDWPAIQTQLKKAHSPWGSLSTSPVREGAKPRDSGMFCKAVAQAVLLCGCESWVLTDKVWKVLESFHNRAARRTEKDRRRRQSFKIVGACHHGLGVEKRGSDGG